MKFIKIIFPLFLSFILSHSIFPCTEFLLQAKDNTVFVTRTLEYALDLYSNLRTSNRNRKFVMTAPNGKPGLSWNSKYGYVFLDSFNFDAVVDGMNEKGLSFSALYLPGFTAYQTVPKNHHKLALSYIHLGDWILSNFSSVEDVQNALKKIYVFGESIKEFGDMIFPLHFSVYDAAGNGLVIEYINGELYMYKNNMGVLTNSPTYDWHLTNLNNYLNLNPFNPNPMSFNGIIFAPVGHGFGMMGLPGDISPPSRFVKIATLLRVSMPTYNASDTLNLASHIINTVDIPRGFVRDTSMRDPRTGSIAMETPQWTVFKDLSHKELYFRTYGNLQLRAISLDKINFSPNARRLNMPISDNQVVQNVTSNFLNSSDLEDKAKSIIVTMIPATGQNAHGTVKFTQLGNTLLITGEAFGLTPGAHGFHIHEHNTCEGRHDFKEAGGHFNPTHVPHGSPESGHAGDLGNIYADQNGKALIYVKTQRININPDNELSILNRTVMIHAKQDDLKTDPAGNSGDRILCAVID